MNLAQRFDQSLNELLGRARPASIGVAVSGGGDSTALLMLLTGWAKSHGASVCAVTVDHGLREGSQGEAENVASHCANLGVEHDIVTWTGWDGSGNLQDQARRARYRLIGDWARARGISHVTLGHTLDDQAETVLMRMARGSGVDGLSGMAGARVLDGVQWLRPLLDTGRAELRDYLRALDVDWADDPSNDDARFDRVNVRAALDVLEPLGVTRQGLADTAARMRSARQALEQTAHDAARLIVSVGGGTLNFDVKALFDLPAETRRRLLVHGLCWVASEDYAPRASAIAVLERAIRAHKATTLHGCLITASTTGCSIGREPAAVAQTVVDIADVWDGRWRLNGPAKAGQSIGATGDNGLKSCPKWRKSGFSRATLVAGPAVWVGLELVAAPLAGFANGWRAELVHGENHFYDTILTH